MDRLSGNLNAFADKDLLMNNYLSQVKHHVKDDYAVIIIDNSDIAKPASRKLEALSEIKDGSTGEITQGYFTIEAAVLSERGKMPLPVYEKVFSAAEEGFVIETHENLCCLESLSENFSPKCVRTLDRGFDANAYYRYFLQNGERFVIRAKKNRTVIYNGKTYNIMDVASQYKGNYRMDFKDKSGRAIQCKMSCVPVRLCEFPSKEMVLTVVYGFGAEPMLLLSNLKMQEKKRLCHIIAKVYLLRWRIENLFATLAVGYIGLTTAVHEESIYLAELKECSRRIYEMPKFVFYALGYALERVLSMSRSGISTFLPPKVKSQQLNLFDDSSRRAIQNAFSLIYGLKLPSEIYSKYAFAEKLEEVDMTLPKVYMVKKID